MEAKGKHTHWKIVRGSNHDSDNQEHVSIRDVSGWWIAKIEGDIGDDKGNEIAGKQMANARLISKAYLIPEVREVLGRLKAVQGVTDSDFRPLLDDIIEDASDLIAKLNEDT